MIMFRIFVNAFDGVFRSVGFTLNTHNPSDSKVHSKDAVALKRLPTNKVNCP